MFKKAKLLSLFTIIITSVAIGFFAYPETVFAACPEGQDCITYSEDDLVDVDGVSLPTALKFKGDDYEVIPSNNLANFRKQGDFNASPCTESPAVYYHFVNPGMHMICLFSSDNSTSAKFIYFPDASSSISETYPSGYNLGSYNDEANVAIDGEIGDVSAAEPHIPTDEKTDSENSSSACQIKGIGWLVCPVVHFLAEVTDNSYDMLDKTFLRLEPIVLPGDGSNNDERMQLYNSWKVMRDFANIAFIIAFLIIVFSQVTSIGVSNYGIKRLLPKIIIAAILVNLSYFICAIAVDLSNILGNQLRDILMPGGRPDITFEFTHDNKRYGGPGSTGFVGAANIVLGAGILAGIVYVFLPAFLPIVLAAALAVATAIIVLTLRQALVVILIVVSPLAFVALLLPNTEGYFQKWKSLFTAMLLVYPVISVVFGASALASAILMSTDDFPTQMIGAGVSVIPLFITPLIMKASGGLLNRWVGMVNDPAKGPIDGMKKGVQGQADRLENRRKITSLKGGGRRFLGARYRRTAKSEAIDAGLKAEASRSGQQYVAEEIGRNGGDNKFAKQVAGGGLIDKADPGALERAVASAQFTVQKAEIEEVKAAGVTVEGMNLSQLDRIMNDLDENGSAKEYSSSQKAAALSRMIKIGDPEDYESYVNSYGSSDKKEDSIVRSTLVEALAKDGPGFLKGSDLDTINNGQLGKQRVDKNGNSIGENAKSLADIARSNSETGALSQAKMAADSKGNLKYAMDNASPKGKEMLGETAEKLLGSESLSGQIKHNKEQIEDMAKFAPPKPTQPTGNTGAANPQTQPQPTTATPNQAPTPSPNTRTAGVNTAGWTTAPTRFIYPPSNQQGLGTTTAPPTQPQPQPQPQPQQQPPQNQPPVQGTKPSDV